jgi:ParB family chromosome partitioning protein
MSKAKKQKKVLGRGLAALLDDSGSKSISFNKPKNNFSSSEEINIEHIEINPNQPRLNIDNIKLENLSDSIKELGIIQPITVRKVTSDKYQIISGERRFRASKLAGLISIPCYIKRIDGETDSLKMALVENVQRVDLDPIEIALTYNRLINELNITQNQLSKIVGKDRTTISNIIRLLKLDPIVQSGIRDGFLSMGHGRALINIEKQSDQLNIYEKIISGNLSVRQTEKLVKNKKSAYKQSNRSSDVSRIYMDATTKFETFFNSKVNIKENSSGKVSLNAVFENIDKLYEILKKISN